MWISSGCRGQFVCHGNRMTCGYQGLAYTTPRHHCTCAPLHVGGTFLSETGKPLLTLPTTLVSNGQHPRLEEAREGMPRFIPHSTNESLSSTFTLWNILDATMHATRDNTYQTGYVRELQMRRMVELARQPRLLRDGGMYCEIGFNGGHSASAMLFANPRLTVHSFDLMRWHYSQTVVDLLKLQFGDRFHMHPGNSLKTVPPWVSEHPTACDVILVDGDHTAKGALADMRNMRYAAAPNSVAVADDINVDPGKALEALAANGEIELLESYGPFEAPSPHNPCMRSRARGPICLPWGFAVYSYRDNATSCSPLHPCPGADEHGRGVRADGSPRHGKGNGKSSKSWR